MEKSTYFKRALFSNLILMMIILSVSATTFTINSLVSSKKKKREMSQGREGLLMRRP